MIQVIKQVFPGSFEFFLLGVSLGVALSLRRASQRWGTRCLIALTVMYWFLSLPLGAQTLLLGLTSELHQWEPKRDAPIQAVVILDAGTVRIHAGAEQFEQVNRSGALRVTEALRIHKYVTTSSVFIVSSGSHEPSASQRPEGTALRDALVRAGIPPERVILDSTSRTTQESAVTLSKSLPNASCVILVTSAVHMRRAILSFRSQGIEVIPAPASETPQTRKWFPSLISLQQSEQAIYEYCGLAYYWLRGFTRNPEGRLGAGASPACAT